MSPSRLNTDPEIRSLLAEMKIASGDEIGSLYATIGEDNRYWSRVSAKKNGDTVTITISGGTAFMGSDGPGGSVPDPDKLIATVPANGPAVVKALKAAISKDDTLSRYGKLKNFEWHLGRDSKRTLGLNAENAQKAIDYRNLPWDVWDAKWVKPPPAAPLKVKDGLTLNDLADDLRRNGVALSEKPARWAGKSDRYFGYKLLDTKTTRLVNLMNASFPVSQKGPQGLSFYMDYQHRVDGDGFFLVKSHQWDMDAKPRPVKMNIYVLTNHI